MGLSSSAAIAVALACSVAGCGAVLRVMDVLTRIPLDQDRGILVIWRKDY